MKFQQRFDGTRREFIVKSLSMGLAAGSSLFFGRRSRAFAGRAAVETADLAAVRNGEPDVMFEKAMAALGGMERFVGKGQSVVVKPNIAFPKAPEIGATTNPLLVKTIVRHCFEAGAKKVYVFDHVGSMSRGMEANCYRNSGIEEAAKSEGALVVPADNEKYYQQVEIPGAVALGSAKVHELILESDVFINVPILKHHSYTFLSIGMKNLMGTVWDQMDYHYKDLDQCIAEFCLFKKPDLTVVDAYRTMMKYGPQGTTPENVALKKALLASADIVAADSAAAKIFGLEPGKIEYIRKAHELGIGNIDLDRLNIVKHVL